jgi:paraquat-inducible protein B
VKQSRRSRKVTDTNPSQHVAKIEKIKHWSPIWIIPIVTTLIGAWILFYHFSHQGPQVVLTTLNAEGIEAGKTKIKSRSVNVGVVEQVTLSKDLNHVIIQARLNAGMNTLLHGDTVFWVVKPQIGREGVSGLGTLLSGAYIELQPGSKGKTLDEFVLLDSPPLASPDAKGIRIILDSDQAGQLNASDPVLFRGYRVGSVESSTFDTKSRLMRYQLFIGAPYDSLVTTNVRFWKDSGVAVDLSSQGMRVEMAALATLFSGGVSFDVPDGLERGKAITQDRVTFKLFDNRSSIQNSLYTEHEDFLLFFSDSVRGLQSGAPVEFRGIRVGTVADVPFFAVGMKQRVDNDFRIPVLIRIERGRFRDDLESDANFAQILKTAKERGLRASLKSGNLLTGALFIDLDFYPDAKPWKDPLEVAGYPLLPTTSGGLAQIQQKLMQTLDKINNLPLDSMLNEVTKTLAESQRTMRETQKTLEALTAITANPAMQDLPKDLQKTLNELSRSMKGFQPGSPAYNKMVGDMQRLDHVLRELQPVLWTLNEKSNALVFEAAGSQDPQPKKAKK